MKSISTIEKKNAPRFTYAGRISIPQFIRWASFNILLRSRPASLFGFRPLSAQGGGYPLTQQRPRRKWVRHGYTGTSIWNIWRTMRQRCENPNSKDYRYYGALGVRVCTRWQTFLGFFRDMGDRPPDLTLERVNPCGNYEPSNVRWATRLEQRHNHRDTLTHRHTTKLRPQRR